MYLIDENFVNKYMCDRSFCFFDGKLTGYIETGFSEIDVKLGGLKRGDTYLLVGNAFMGQRELAYNICSNLINNTQSFPVTVLFSFDEKKEQVVDKMAVISTFGMNGTEADNYQSALNSISSGFWYLEDRCLNIDEIYTSCKLIESAIDLIVIDYLQLIKGDNLNIGYKLKQIAKEFNCALLVTCNLNQSVDERVCHMPTLLDVYNVVDTKQYDNIWAVYRDEYYYRDYSEKPGIMDLSILKPFSENGKIELVWIDKYKKICCKQTDWCSMSLSLPE